MIYELVPRFVVVIIHVFHFYEHQSVVLSVSKLGNIGSVSGLLVLRVLHKVYDLVSGRKILRRLRERIPVAARKIRHFVLYEVVQISVLESVGYHFPCPLRLCVRGVVKLFQLECPNLAPVARHALSVRIVQSAHFAVCQHVVQCVVRVVPYRKVVCARVERVAAFLALIRSVRRVFVVRREDIVRKLQLHFVAFPGRKLYRLAEVRQLYRGFLRLSFFPRQLYVQLHHVLGFAFVRLVAVIRDFYRCRHRMRFAVPVQRRQLLREAGIRLSASERIRHLVGIVPFAAFARKRSRRALRVVHVQHAILVPGFVILVSDIYAFRVYGKLVFIQCVEIRELAVTRILYRRRRQRVRRIRINQSARRIRLARKDIRNARHSVAARISYPQARVHVVFVQPAQIHGITAVYQHYRLVELARRPDHIQKVFFFLMQRQFGHTCGAVFPRSTVAVVQTAVAHAVVQLAFLSAVTAQDDYRRVSVDVERRLHRSIYRRRYFPDVSRLSERSVFRLNRVKHRVVDRESRRFHRVV